MSGGYLYKPKPGFFKILKAVTEIVKLFTDFLHGVGEGYDTFKQGT